MNKTLADKIYLPFRRAWNFQAFIYAIAENSVCNGIMSQAGKIERVVFILKDGTSLTMENKPIRGGQVWVEMVSGLKSGIRRLFVEGADLDNLDIPLVMEAANA